ncbi:MAG: UDP-N-acetylmuramoyl-L-alanyl-D-glutamate--2,6-diaminopimelate ligase [Clostridiaceae bacterium]
MQLLDILKGLDYKVIAGNTDLEVNSIQYDSRKVENNDLFIAISGFATDGHKFVDKATDLGAKVVVVEKDVNVKDSSVTVIKVENGRKTLAMMAANFYHHPERKLKIIGITGTNGKTTSTFMLKSILESCGKKVGLIGTIANYINNKRLKSERTTPESLELFKLLDEMVKEDIDYCVMEVSSHSLELNRVHGIEFSSGIYTNLTQDHLDFHETFENYFNAKAKLFECSKNKVINVDDSYSERLIKKYNSTITYSIDGAGELNASSLNMYSKGVEFKLSYKGETYDVKINIPGRYNVHNALGCIGAALCEGLSMDDAIEGIQGMFAVPGRCEIVTHNSNLDYDIVIDYAHTPDGLENILSTAREFTEGKLISVFGCGGDRDKTKRPIMGEIGSRLSDIAIVTSDNPRSEEPMEIINDILEGINKDNYLIEENRRSAIKKAMETAKKGDVIVIAGKGHEDYQIIKDKVIHFDEREVVQSLIKELYLSGEINN